MRDVHPYAARLTDTIRRRKNQRINIRFRSLLQGFGYRRRTAGIIAEIHGHLNDCGLIYDFDSNVPYSLDERVSIALAEMPSAAPVRVQAQPPDRETIPDLADIAAMAIAATVEIMTESGFGSGFLVHPEGLIVTGRHVVQEDGYSLRTVKVKLADDRVVDGIVFRSHRQLDFALLWLLADGPFPVLPLGNPQNLRHAQTVLAIGAPSGLSKTVTKGIVSNPKQLYNLIECIQTDAAIDHGNSGGPLVSQDGVLGITLWGLGNVDSAKFIVPIDYLIEDIMDAVRKGRKACLEAAYCPACGYNDDERPVWYCRNCGVEFEKESKSDQKDA